MSDHCVQWQSNPVEAIKEALKTEIKVNRQYACYLFSKECFSMAENYTGRVAEASKILDWIEEMELQK